MNFTNILGAPEGQMVLHYYFGDFPAQFIDMGAAFRDLTESLSWKKDFKLLKAKLKPKVEDHNPATQKTSKNFFI